MKTVMIFGTFDIVHPGHLHLFKQAKKYGDQLVAVIARDARVQEVKKKKPVYTDKERKYFLEQIKLVDKVVLGDKHDVYKKIRDIKPDVLVLGYDQIHFTENLVDKIKGFGLKTKIVTAKPHQPNRFKSSLLRKMDI